MYKIKEIELKDKPAVINIWNKSWGSDVMVTRGFEFKAIYLNAIEEARRIKPEIPMIGYDDIPIKHEIEMELKL